MNITLIEDSSSEQLIAQAVKKSIDAITRAWNGDRDAQIVITGGRTGLAIAKAVDIELFKVATSRPNNSVISKKVHVWFSDERFTSINDPDRNDTVLINGFQNSAGICIFHRVATPENSSLIAAAKSYSDDLVSELSGARFDAVILSMGEDGHIASCFPGQMSELTSLESAVAITASPKPPQERVSITLRQLSKADLICIFALGSDKGEALHQTLAGSDLMPIELLKQNSPIGQIFILTDQFRC